MERVVISARVVVTETETGAAEALVNVQNKRGYTHAAKKLQQLIEDFFVGELGGTKCWQRETNSKGVKSDEESQD